MAEIKLPRLGKAASEFNISTQTVIDLLHGKGMEIDNNINTKLTEDQYAVLINEYQREKEVKQKAQEIVIGTLPVQPEKKSETPPPFTKKTTEKKPIFKTEMPKMEATPPVEKQESLVDAPKEEMTQPEEGSSAIKEEKKVESGIKILGKIELPEKKKSKAAEKETSQKSMSQKEKKEKESVIPTVPEKTESTENHPTIQDAPPETPSKESSEKQEPHKTEHYETSVAHLQGTKVVGTIDLSSFTSRSHNKHPHKDRHKNQKSGNQKQQTAQQPQNKDDRTSVDPVVPKVVVSQPVPKPEVPAPRIPEHYATKVAVLQGPKILGKIELPVEKKPEKGKPFVNKEEAEKRKRKRIRKKEKPTDQRKPPVKPAEPVKVEISEADIKRQIRETQRRVKNVGKTDTAKHAKEKRRLLKEEMQKKILQDIENQKILKVTEFITANELANLMNVPVTKIISVCMGYGIFVSINQRLDAETISILAEEHGFGVEFVGVDDDDDSLQKVLDNQENLSPRHPIITVMGHVDHGKTSLLDYIRKSNVIAGEAGGITQHIGAYEVELPDGRKITFLDTPGHEAFTAMRARGAKITDVCIIVIAADDAVMPQTVEAINHAQAAGVPMVFAFTKIDKPNANAEKIRESLSQMNILVEDWGGKYQCQEIDAKHGTNVRELLEKVLLEAEMLELKANPDRPGIGTVIESSLDKGKGYVAKVLVQSGTMSVGDPILAGSCYGKVRALYNERNQNVQSAGPATPVLLLGLNGAPQAGDIFKVCASDHEARLAATKKAQLVREMGMRAQKHITLDEIGRRIAIGDFKELNIIVKGDVDGSVEALSDSLLKLSTEQVQVNVIHKAVGAVTESDVILASASNAVIVAFQVRPTLGSRKLAEQEEIDIRTYSVIYKAIEEIKDAIAGMHTPEIQEKILCNLEIREVFKITKVGTIAGCFVLDGKLQRNNRIRLIRDGIVIHTGKLESLKRFKDDVKEVAPGQDCGLNIENFNDIKVGDIIEGFEEFEVKVTL